MLAERFSRRVPARSNPDIGRWIPRAALLGVVLLVAGCGNGNPAGSQLNKPVSFPPVTSTGNGITPGTTPNQPHSAQLSTNQVRLTLQLPTKLATGGTPIRRNLVVATPTAIRLVKVDTQLQVQQSYNINTENQSDGSVIVTIPSGTFDRPLPKGPEYVFQVDAATTAGTLTLMAPAADNNQDIKVNAFSDYLVNRVFTTFTDAEISQLQTCLNQQSLCVNGFVWPTLNDQVQDFEITIPDNTNEAGAMDFLAQRADFTQYIAGMKRTLLLPESNLTTSVSAGTFNVMMFAPELDAAYQADGSSYGQWGIRTQTTGVSINSSTGVQTSVYPTLSYEATTVLGLNITSLSSDIPYARVTQLDKSATDVTTASNWETNTHSTGSSAAGLENHELLAGRSLLQSVTRTGTDHSIGWAPNPYFMDGDLVGSVDSPNALVNSFFHGGKAIHVALTNNAYERKETLEDDFVAGLEVAIVAPGTNQSVTAATLDNKNYNTISLAMDLTGATSAPQVVTGRLAPWTVASGNISQGAGSQTVLTRSASGAVVPPATTASAADTYTVPGPGGTAGLLVVTNSSGTRQTAAAAPDGSILAMGLSNQEDGKGILVALQQPQSTLDLSSRTYKLQGVSIGLENDSNVLDQINNSTLVFTGSSSADLNVSYTAVTNNLGNGSVTAPTTGGYTASSSLVTVDSNGKVTMTFDPTTGVSDNKALSVEGYANSDGSLLILKVVHGNAVGLFFGYQQ